MQQKNFTLLTWGLFALSTVLPLLVWGNTVNWDFSGLTAYQWFPLFGLLAWMIMWTHYITGAIRIRNPELKKPAYYSKVTSYIVLGSLLLHPGMLAIAQFQNDQGLPVDSFVNYVGEGLRIAVLLGSVSLLIFLSFEFFDRAKHIGWVKRSALWISLSQSVAMLLIFVHGLRLGTSVNTSWFTLVWVIYGLLLLPCFYIIHKSDLEQREKIKLIA
jgi:hypothetical protein